MRILSASAFSGAGPDQCTRNLDIVHNSRPLVAVTPGRGAKATILGIKVIHLQDAPPIPKRGFPHRTSAVVDHIRHCMLFLSPVPTAALHLPVSFAPQLDSTQCSVARSASIHSVFPYCAMSNSISEKTQPEFSTQRKAIQTFRPVQCTPTATGGPSATIRPFRVKGLGDASTGVVLICSQDLQTAGIVVHTSAPGRPRPRARRLSQAAQRLLVSDSTHLRCGRVLGSI